MSSLSGPREEVGHDGPAQVHVFAAQVQRKVAIRTTEALYALPRRQTPFVADEGSDG